jgi:hypothetical protein
LWRTLLAIALLQHDGAPHDPPGRNPGERLFRWCEGCKKTVAVVRTGKSVYRCMRYWHRIIEV